MASREWVFAPRLGIRGDINFCGQVLTVLSAYECRRQSDNQVRVERAIMVAALVARSAVGIVKASPPYGSIGHRSHSR
ncbi:hypothetical protein H5410_026162 [Solanum commersonii]|uniref:Uncharacterized protein n=1 Tax=Solanum commersonii TaxID=4109 RepID=A0A9J5Z0P3_SOLCO|nr:hypothetical protein H5410_026162 [Solanum commersonii]